MALATEPRVLSRTPAIIFLTGGAVTLLEIERLWSRLWRRAPVDTIQKWTGRYGRAACRLFGLDLIKRGPFLDTNERYPGKNRATGRGRVFVVNHRSMLDIFVCLHCLEGSFVSRADVAQWPLVGIAAKRTGTLFVTRGDKRSGTNLIEAMKNRLCEGGGVIVFSEGTTFEGDDVRPLRSGAFRAALAADTQIVPVGIAYENANTFFGDEPFSQHFRNIASLEKSRAAVVAGDPLEAGSDPLAVMKNLTRMRMQSLVCRARDELTTK